MDRKIIIIGVGVLFFIIALIVGVSRCSNQDNSSSIINEIESAVETDEQSNEDNEDKDIEKIKEIYDPLEVSKDTIVNLHEFNDGYALVEFAPRTNDNEEEYDSNGDEDDEYDNRGENSYFACVDEKGKLVFSDYNGLKDSSGKEFYIDHRFNTSFDDNSSDYYSEWEKMDTECKYEPYLAPDCFSDGFICVLCRDCLPEDNGDYYICTINSKGEVVYSFKVDSYDASSNRYCWSDNDTYSSGPNIVIQNNGNKTYLVAIENDNGENATYYAISAENGLLKKEEYGDMYNRIYSLGFGYFRCYEEKASVKKYKDKSYVIDQTGSIFTDEKFLNINRFVSNTLGELSDGYGNYYNINTKKTIDFMANAEKIAKKTGDENNFWICDFNADRNYAGCIITKGDCDNLSNVYFTINSEGEIKQLNSFKGDFDDDYEEESLNGNYQILSKDQKYYYSLNLKTGELKQLFKEYAEELEEIVPTGGVIAGTIYGKNRKYYKQVVNVNDKVVLELEENDDEDDNFYSRQLDDATGFIYNGFALTIDGKIDCDGWSPYFYKDGLVYLAEELSSDNHTYNIMTKDGKLLF